MTLQHWPDGYLLSVHTPVGVRQAKVLRSDENLACLQFADDAFHATIPEPGENWPAHRCIYVKALLPTIVKPKDPKP